MQIIYTISIAEDADSSGKVNVDAEEISLITGHLETEAHQWMRENYPEVKFDTHRVVKTVGSEGHSQILADTEKEQAQARQILDALNDHLCKTLQIRYPNIEI